MGGHKPKAIAGEHDIFLVQRIRDREFTLRGLVAELSDRGLKVDYRSVWNFVHAEKLSFKKKPSSPATNLISSHSRGVQLARGDGREGAV
jgi:transposase